MRVHTDSTLQTLNDKLWLKSMRCCAETIRPRCKQLVYWRLGVLCSHIRSPLRPLRIGVRGARELMEKIHCFKETFYYGVHYRNVMFFFSKTKSFRLNFFFKDCNMFYISMNLRILQTVNWCPLNVLVLNSDFKFGLHIQSGLFIIHYPLPLIC